MKIILTAINAKYIHSNLAIYSLKAYAKKYAEHIFLAEYTINQQLDEILMDIYKQKPDVLCFSCYIWNISYVETLIREIHKILPSLPIWLGGPEVSYDAEEVLRRLPEVTGVVKGEGEETFLELASYYVEGKGEEYLCGIKGISYRKHDGEIEENQWREIMDLSKVPFVYEDMDEFRNKIIYYETSRGCPFSCSYCLSSVDKCLRFRDLKLVKKELQFFLDNEVPQVKFVDRTFNCKHDHALEIWRYIAENDNGITNFHFEISADLLNEEELALLGTMREGLVQLEIGVQSTNPKTIGEIKRTMRFEKVSDAVKRVNAGRNIHQHLDLIAGLPYEDYESFGTSFNDVYALSPEQLQLGFLKVLKGSYMEEHTEEYGLVYKSLPPYEVLYTKWLSYEDVLKLKRIEEMVEVYYNSGQFSYTLEHLTGEFATPFAFFEQLGEYYEKHAFHMISHSRITRYEILLGFVEKYVSERVDFYRELLVFDLYLRENIKSRPVFAGENTVDKEWLSGFYEEESKEHKYLRGYEKYDKRQLRKMTHIEKFNYDVLGNGTQKDTVILFDYQNRSKLNYQATIFRL
ncbi:B12-binding domain-containing radical SAM protein [Faecalimonas canis]